MNFKENMAKPTIANTRKTKIKPFLYFLEIKIVAGIKIPRIITSRMCFPVISNIPSSIQSNSDEKNK